MPDLYHQPLCPKSRFVRLVLAEHGLDPVMIEERVRERRRDFLALNPAGQVPVYVEDGFAACGPAVIAEYIDELHGAELGPARLVPGPARERAEMRRLVDWFNLKFHAEVSEYLVHEKITRRFTPITEGGGGPDMGVVRAARANLRWHVQYVGHLAAQRHWLGGDRLTLADLAAAAQLSCADFLGDVPWQESEAAKEWYARIKSRPSFRPLLNDRVPGLSPSPAYADLDF